MAERDFSGGVLWPRNLWSFTFRHRSHRETGDTSPRHVVQFLGNSDASIPKTGTPEGRCEIE
jgi:hypothetical protein